MCDNGIEDTPTPICPDTAPHARHRIADTRRAECPDIPTTLTATERRIASIDAQIADLQAKRAALLNPPLRKDDIVEDIPTTDIGPGGRPVVRQWRVTGVGRDDPRRVSLISLDGTRSAWDRSADTLRKIS